MKKYLIIFLSAFATNVVWENAHSFLYSNYKGGLITEFILVRAALFDAILIILILTPFIFVSALKNKSWLILIIGIMIAIFNEWYGLSTERWMYNALMPIVPIIKVGLTPTFQLGVLAYLSFKIQDYFCGRTSS